MKYFFLLLLLFSQYCRADCNQESDQCAIVGEWNFAVSVGAGVYTNPLNGGDNTPLILIPEISYYGEKIFFENNTLGYTLFNGQQLVVSTIIQLNHEKAYFTRWHPQNIFLDSSAPSNIVDKDEVDNAEGNNDNDSIIPEITIDDVSSKRWAVDSGIQLNWFIDSSTDVEVQILHDINNVYNGFNGQFQLNRMLKFEQLPNTRMSYSFGTNVNSKNLVDYFYGVPPAQAQNKTQAYQGKLSINPYFRLALVHQISADWSAKFNVKRVFLDSNMTDSPLVKDNHINTIFAGVTYDF
ncbi:MipA/OmpV family protein [Colwellia sp. 6_MG-2023]|uniref:MipA/OmpV family protein n=1 Tax=Colwellia sp. 6_MG-2023 TaxID=3062676 RepID=UPI0026E2E333|nr:MipA/OmpV family protein [Colwellia sp. 6_MG-2023]MDO6488512.1 MipA/OmpV family protein [Colwellia sp. 6_MG-2023]